MTHLYKSFLAQFPLAGWFFKKSSGRQVDGFDSVAIDERKAIPVSTTIKYKISSALFFLALAILFHAPHFLSYKSETTIDFFLHYNWTKELVESMRMGDIYPRWIYHGSYGLGEPALLYYSPMYYWTTGLMSVFGGSTWFSMHLAEIASSAIFAWFIFRAIAYYVSLPLALIAGALALFNPFYILLQYKFHGFPWAFAFASHGFLLWSLLRPKAEPHFVNICASLAIGIATLSHTVSALIALICFSAVAIFRAPRATHGAWVDVRSVAGWLVTAALGLSLSAVYLLPALASMKFVNSAAMTKKYVPWNAFSFPVFTRSNGYFWFSFQWPISIIAAITFFVPTLYIAKKMGSEARTTYLAYLLIGCGLTALFFSSELSYPLWLVETPLRKIQFPFRFISIVSIVSILLICLATDNAFRFRQKSWGLALAGLLLLLGITSGLMFVKASYLDGHALPAAIQSNQYTFLDYRDAFLKPGFRSNCSDVGSDCEERRRRAESFLGLEEYSILTRGVQWLEFARSGFEQECSSQNLQCQELARTRMGRSWKITGKAPTTILRLPQFDFPAWDVLVDGNISRHRTDPQTGVITLDLPEGSHTVSVIWQRLPSEQLGLLISTAAGLALCAIAWRRRQFGC